MKKFTKIASLFLALLTIIMVVSACGSSGGVTGKYYLDATSEDLSGLGDLGEGLEDLAKSTYIELNNGGKGKMAAFGMELDLTYTIDGEKIELTLNMFGETDTTVGTIKNGVITLEDGSVYKK